MTPKTASIGLGAVGCFVALAYALSWAWTFPFAVAGDVIDKGAGWPTHLPSLLGPAVAAIVVTGAVGGRTALRALLAGIGRWRFPLGWWAAALSPLVFLGVALVISAASGKLPAERGFGLYSGLPPIGVAPIVLIVILAAVGEETGWRGLALPALQRRHGALAAALLVTPIWAVWHLPLFFTVTTYRDFAPPAYAGFVFGLACGSIVLTWLYNMTGGSILACAVWHGLFNIASGTAAASGTVAAVTSTLVIAQAFLLVALELRAGRHGRASVIGPR